MNRILLVIFLYSSFSSLSQSSDQLKLKGSYTTNDSIQIIEAYKQARESVDLMYKDMLTIQNALGKKVKWDANPAFNKWLGSSEQMEKSFRRIRKIHSKFQKNITLYITKKNKGRCTGWISAWTLPYGAIKIRLCEDFFIYRTHLQEKVLVHEIGHETGLLSHHRIHGCRAALRAATNDGNLAKRSTENYAWLAMSYLGIECSSR